jgi:3-oxoadipate CoA-transferase, alpha subunit
VIDKVLTRLADAVADVRPGSTILVSGFGDAGSPIELVEALLGGPGDLTIVANNAGFRERGIAALIREGQVRKVICSFPRSPEQYWFERRHLAGEVELELVPQGTLTERIRAAGAGIGAFYTATSAGTPLGEGKEHREINGRTQVLEHALSADVALVKADRADRWGNLVYRKSARNYAPTMAMAGRLTIAQVRHVDPLGRLDPEAVVTPGIFVDRVIAL